MNYLKRALGMIGVLAILVIAASFLAPRKAHALVAALVEVVNTPANPVPTTLPTHLGVRPCKFITLTCTFAIICNSFSQVMPDGTTSPFTIPSGEELLITDIDWTTFNGAPGQAIQVFLQASCPSCTSQPFVLTSAGLANADGFASQSEHLTSGVLLSRVPIAELQSSSELYALNLHGYLVP